MDVMIDLETMGTGPNSAIVAIGAVIIDFNSDILKSFFYQPVLLNSSVEAGMAIDADTVTWWINQSSSARELFKSSNLVSINEALCDFNVWLDSNNKDESEIKIWGNGSDFDNVILLNAYKLTKMKTPWVLWNNRCYRTVKNLFPNVAIDNIGVKHNALDDAISQALHLMEINKAFNLNLG